MKRLLWAALLLLAPAAHAITYQSVRASTATILTPTIQVGTMNLSSGTVSNMTHTNLTTQFLTVNSTASFVGVTGSTITYSSATFTNMNVTGTGTIATLNTSNGNVTLTTAAITGISGSTITYSSATFTGAHVTGAATVDGALTGGSLTTTGASSLTGDVTLGGSAHAVTISSNAVLGATKLYASGAASIVSDTATLSGSFTVQNSSTNSCGYIIGTLVGYQKYTSSTSSATTVTNFAPTNLTGPITPKCASDIIRYSVAGCIQGTNPAAGDAVAALFRGSTDLSVSGSLATGCMVGDGGVSTQLNVGCGWSGIDTPATTSATTYTVKMRMETGGGTVTFGNNCGQQLTLEDIAR
jgi:hypothetical protein